ncbi:MAG: hypothetical protein JST49_04410, partial [Bacteroidetes bacterium]|nr:hypothetical protein [Bacteroidota bacterium]
MENELIEAAKVQSSFWGTNAYLEFLVRYGINLFIIFIIVRLIYYPRHKNKDFLFTFFLFNTVNFLICF